MNFTKPLLPTSDEYVFQLAPIPVYQRIYDDTLSNSVYNLGLKVLDDKQKLMGQELPKQYDSERQSTYGVNYDRQDQWVENHEFPPIGSRFYTPPNNFLYHEDENVNIIKRRIFNGFYHLLDTLNLSHNKDATITESWLQYYDPYSGRGHNAHNHCRWHHEEAKPIMFSGGYYLSDGEPIADHPYSGVFAFHIRGMKYYIRPKKGMLLIWPYDIVHSVEPFYGKSHRAVINFNIQVG
jgi:hypothetical protein